MNRKWLTRIGVSLLVLAGLVAVGGLAFRAGQHHDDAVGELVVGDEGVRTVVVSGGWRHGVARLRLRLRVPVLPAAHRRPDPALQRPPRRWGGPWRGREEELRQWHQPGARRGAGPATQQAQATQPTQPPQPPQPPERRPLRGMIGR